MTLKNRHDSIAGFILETYPVRVFCLLMTLCMLTQCAHVDLSRRSVSQGNTISKEKVNRLKVGMSREDVATLLGASLLSPLFNEDRLDYVETSAKGVHATPKVQHLSLYFKNDRLVSIARA